MSTNFNHMSKEQAITYCYTHRNQYINDAGDVDAGIEGFECLIVLLESETISAIHLPKYGMDY